MKLSLKQAVILGLAFKDRGYPGMTGYLQRRVLRQNCGAGRSPQNEPQKEPNSSK